MFIEPRVHLLVLAFYQLFRDLLLNRLNLLPHCEVIVELGLDLAFAWELGEEKVQEVDQSIESVTYLNDPI